MFTVEQRDALRARLLRLAAEDERVVAGAAVGSLAVDGGDRFSDLDLTFSIADHVPVADVLNDWTRTLIDALAAVPLADLARGPTTYRVFLLPDALQVDLSMTPAAQFRPAGPRFRRGGACLTMIERHFPLFLSRPRPQVLHYWAAPHASLRWVDVLGMLRHVEQLYPRWQVQALFENQRNRYEVLLLDRQQTVGVHLVRTVAEFQRAVQ